jgi:hypothetical protein
VSRRQLWALAVAVVLLAGLLLRLRGIHSPLLDHPGWRQGDTAAIARNFATLDFNPFHPQTDYDGPPPNYVELELQIVPFLAATLYKIFGIHEVFGRLITMTFSLATVALLAFFGRYVFRDGRGDVAGIAAAALYAVYPGSVYYGRTFMPDTTMVFFLTAALFATVRFFDNEDARSWRGFWPAALLLAAAVLAKPVALVAAVPVAVVSVARFGVLGTLRRPQSWALAAVALGPYLAYDAYLSRIAEWHWASGITKRHVLPSLAQSLTSAQAAGAKLRAWWGTLGLLGSTMLGPAGLGAFAVAILVPVARRARPLLFGWLAGAALYAFAVVTVERVDYYLYLVLPLAALWTGGALARGHELLGEGRERAAAATAVIALLVAVVAWDGRHRVARYYAYSREVYQAAKALDATLDPGALIVMGHYDPSVLYYINRKGWEEDPYLWTPFDEQSAIRKGARYFVAIENNRFKRNVELYAWMQRFGVRNPDALWPVYETDNAKLLTGAEDRWREFRRREKAGELPQTPQAKVPPSS